LNEPHREHGEGGASGHQDRGAGEGRRAARLLETGDVDERRLGSAFGNRGRGRDGRGAARGRGRREGDAAAGDAADRRAGTWRRHRAAALARRHDDLRRLASHEALELGAQSAQAAPAVGRERRHRGLEDRAQLWRHVGVDIVVGGRARRRRAKRVDARDALEHEHAHREYERTLVGPLAADLLGRRVDAVAVEAEQEAVWNVLDRGEDRDG
jgi:hypothetical protein